MKRVSFKTAKTIKEANYPQIYGPFYASDGDLWENPDEIYNFTRVYYAPTYFEVWLWLWREKHCPIDVCFCSGKWAYFWDSDNISGDMYVHADQEEAIIAAIDYLVENDLIK